VLAVLVFFHFHISPRPFESELRFWNWVGVAMAEVYLISITFLNINYSNWKRFHAVPL
jgi:hypothetical protein